MVNFERIPADCRRCTQYGIHIPMTLWLSTVPIRPLNVLSTNYENGMAALMNAGRQGTNISDLQQPRRAKGRTQWTTAVLRRTAWRRGRRRQLRRAALRWTASQPGEGCRRTTSLTGACVAFPSQGCALWREPARCTPTAPTRSPTSTLQAVRRGLIRAQRGHAFLRQVPFLRLPQHMHSAQSWPRVAHFSSDSRTETRRGRAHCLAGAQLKRT